MAWLIPPDLLATHTATATALVVVPGPAQALIITRIPQLVRPERGHVVSQFVLLGGILAIIDVLWAVVVATAAVRAGARLASSHRVARWRDRITGTVLVALGIRLALSRR